MRILNKLDVKQYEDIDSDTVEELLLKADNYYKNNKLQMANCLYQQAIKLEPNNAYVYEGLGNVASAVGMLFLAVDFFTLACQHKPNDINLNKKLALAYVKISKLDDAIAQYKYVLKLNGRCFKTHKVIAKLYFSNGNKTLSLKHYQQAFQIYNGDHEVIRALVDFDVSVLTADDVKRIENILGSTNLTLAGRSSIYFSLAKIHDYYGNFKQANANYLVANISKKITFDTDAHVKKVTALIDIFNKSLIDKVSYGHLNSSRQMVFLIGMPCSGEDIICDSLISDKNFVTIDDSDYFDDIFNSLDLLNGDDLNQELLIEKLDSAAVSYLNEVNNVCSSHQQTRLIRIMNTSVSNFMNLGLIALLFPNAKIIHCVRNPLETCILNYLNDFSSGHEYAYDQNNIVNYYQQYQRLMAHWQNVLDVEILNIDYHTLSQSAENITNAIKDYVLEDREFNGTQNLNNVGFTNIPDSLVDNNFGENESQRYWAYYTKQLTTLNNAFYSENIGTEKT